MAHALDRQLDLQMIWVLVKLDILMLIIYK